MVLTVIGWVFLGLLCLFGLLLICPVILEFSYRDGEMRLAVRVLFLLRLTLLPAKPAKPRKEKPKKEPKEEKPKEEKPKKERSFSDILALVREGAHAATRAMRIVLKGLWFYGIDVFVPVSADDAAATALRAGQVQAAIGTTRAVLENLLHLRYRRLAVYPDFAGQYKERFTFACKIATFPVIMVAAGLVGLFSFLKAHSLDYRLATRRLPPARRKALKKRMRAVKKAQKAQKKQAAGQEAASA